jgi:hypothetical protein
MMKKYLYIIGQILLTGLVLSSCYKDIDLEDYRTAPKIVLNAVASPDTVVMASITLSSFFTDTAAFACIKDAEVELYVNNVFREKMQWQNHFKKPTPSWEKPEEYDNEGVYVSNVRPQAHDVVKIVANTSSGSVWAEETVPEKIEIEKVELSYRKVSGNGSVYINPDGTMREFDNIEIKYHITFQDTPGKFNYYCIRIEPSMTMDYSSEPVFIEQTSFLYGSIEDGSIDGDGGRAFSDKIIDGKKYTMVATETVDELYGPNVDRKIILYAITESYYYYLLTTLNIEDKLMQNLPSYGLAEPIRIPTNVHGGTSIFAAVNNDSRSIHFKLEPSLFGK